MSVAEAPVSEFDLFRPASPAILRAFAAGAGDWSLLVVREVGKILTEAGGQRLDAIAGGIDELLSRELIRAEEAEALKEMVTTFLSAAHNRAKARSGEAAILDQYRKLSFDRNATPAAVAIASVAARNIQLPEAPLSQPSQQTGAAFAAIQITPGSTGAGAVVGAMVGAGIGGAVGGAVGAGIGAMIGAGAGAAIGFSNENQE